MAQTITLKIPPTLNEQIGLARSHWSKSASAKKRHDRLVVQAAKHLEPYTKGPLYFVFHWQVKTFASDPDNVSAAAKYIMDGLAKAKIIPNDNLACIPGPWVHTFDRGEGTVIVTIDDRPIVQLVAASEVCG